MKPIKTLTLFLFVIVCLVVSIPQMGWSQGVMKGSAPVITASYAVEKGRYGDVLKIYIEAFDPDADMSRIAVSVHQTGYGHYPTDWIVVKPQFRKQMKGFIQWNTFSSRTGSLSEWTNITLTLSIFDRAGHESNEIVFPFVFVSGAHRERKPPAPFNEEELPRLGHVFIDLMDPIMMAGGLRRED